MRPAAFFDRDGTINVDVGYLYEPERLQFVPGTPELIRSFNERGIPVLVVSNQAGIARGYYTEEQMHTLHHVMNDRLKKEYGAHIDAFYFCPHHPDITGPCSCRKPGTGMLERAAADWDVDLARSVLYGDKPKDMECARRMGVRGIYIQDALGLTDRSLWDKASETEERVNEEE